MDRAEEEMRARRQRGCRNGERAARRNDVQRGEEERRRSRRTEQDQVQGRNDAAAAELCDLRERVRLAAAVLEDERRAGLHVDLLRSEVPRARELVIDQLADEVR